MFAKAENIEDPNFNYFNEVFRFTASEAEDLIKTVEAVKQYPAYFGAQQLKAIFYKIKAEYGLFRHYYRDYAVTAAQAMSERLAQDYEASAFKSLPYSLKEDYFQTPIKEVIYAGYVGINHKLESFIEFIKAHAAGKEYGPLSARTTNSVDYERLLKENHAVTFDSLVGTSCLYPRIQKFRHIANRIKHRSGYPKNSADPIIEFITDQQTTFPIQIPLDEFLKDLIYAEAYLAQLMELIIHAFNTTLASLVLQSQTEDGDLHAQVDGAYQEYRVALSSSLKRYRSFFIDNLAAVK